MDNNQQQLLAGLQALQLTADDTQIKKLLDFIKLIAKWNKTYNLTAIRQVDEMVSLHLLDSLSTMPHIVGARIVDIGTGAGLPGIPLAICLPDRHFTLLDSNAKKTRFVQQAVLELKLNNVSIRHQRVEDFIPEQAFTTVITRAFTNLPDIITLTAHLLAADGILLAMKGQTPEAELAQINTQASIVPITLPGIAAQRCLVKIASPEAR